MNAVWAWCFLCVAVPAVATPTPLERVLGTWFGSSTCMGPPGACRDEQVTLHFTRADGGRWPVVLTGEKLVGDRSDTMGVFEMDYDSSAAVLERDLTRGRGHGVWRFELRGDRLEGTLRLLPESTLARVVDVARVPGDTLRPEGGLASVRAAVAPLGFLEGTWRATESASGARSVVVERTYRWGPDRLALHFETVVFSGDSGERTEEGFVTLDRPSGRLVQWSVAQFGTRTRAEVVRADSAGFEVREADAWSVVRRVGDDELLREPRKRDGVGWTAIPGTRYRRLRP